MASVTSEERDADGSAAAELLVLRADVARLGALVEQLRTALVSRCVIEQANGILAERFRLSVDEAFAVLRGSARSARMSLHVLASAVINGDCTPGPIAARMANPPCRRTRRHAYARRAPESRGPQGSSTARR